MSEEARSLFKIIASFLLILYGYFVFTNPETYLPGFMPWSPHIGLIFLFIGLYTLFRDRGGE